MNNQSDLKQYRFLDMSDEEITDFVLSHRKLTLKQDLRRHIFYIIRIYLGIAKGSSKEDLPYLFEWVSRLQSIINNDDTSE